jgi:hypothetical protein
LAASTARWGLSAFKDVFFSAPAGEDPIDDWGSWVIAPPSCRSDEGHLTKYVTITRPGGFSAVP